MFFESIHRKSDERRDGAVSHRRHEPDEADLFLLHAQWSKVYHLKNINPSNFLYFSTTSNIETLKNQFVLPFNI